MRDFRNSIKRPEADKRAPSDHTAVQRAPAARIRASKSIIAEHEIFAGLEGDPGRAQCVLARVQIRLFQDKSVRILIVKDRNDAFFDIYGLPGQTYDPFNEKLGWIHGVAEYDHIAAARIAESLRKLADKNIVAILEG